LTGWKNLRKTGLNRYKNVQQSKKRSAIAQYAGVTSYEEKQKAIN